MSSGDSNTWLADGKSRWKERSYIHMWGYVDKTEAEAFWAITPAPQADVGCKHLSWNEKEWNGLSNLWFVSSWLEYLPTFSPPSSSLLSPLDTSHKLHVWSATSSFHALTLANYLSEPDVCRKPGAAKKSFLPLPCPLKYSSRQAVTGLLPTICSSG